MNPDSEKMVAERVVPANNKKPQSNAKRNRTLGIIAVIIIALIIIIAWTQGPQQSAQDTPVTLPAAIVEPVAPPPIPVPVAEIAPPVAEIEQPLPALPALPAEIVLAAPPPTTLQHSDSQVLLAVADFAPQLAQWLLPSDQLRKWVLTVDLMADGKLPSRYRPINYPLSPFQVERQNAQPVTPGQASGQPATANYSRLQGIIDVVLATEPTTLAEYYRQWLPLLEQAYRELGKKDSFDARFRRALDKALAAQPLAKRPSLIRPSVLYQYADKSLEDANDIEKLLWRMGADNGTKIQGFLRELRTRMDRQ